MRLHKLIFLAAFLSTSTGGLSFCAMVDDPISRGTRHRSAQAQQRTTRESDEVLLPPDDPEEVARARAQAALVQEISTSARKEVEAAVKAVRSPHPQALASALKAKLESKPAEDPIPQASSLRALTDLDGDGAAEMLLCWSRGERFKRRMPEDLGRIPGWILFLFSWDGRDWRSSELMTGNGLYDLYLLANLSSTPAVAIVEDIGGVPYPVIFRYADHAASLRWDSRDIASRYQGYAYGEVEFREDEDHSPPAMFVSGKADPGLLHFPRSGNRGFTLATVYLWDGQAYVPKKTEFSRNEDYTLYRFISALHLHDLRTAYSLVDPAQFLKGEDKSLDAFRKHIEEKLPEFLGNSIFEATDAAPDSPDKFRFELVRDEKQYTYHPNFSNDGKYLLTSLERREEK